MKEENIDLKEKVEIFSNSLKLACDELDKIHKRHNECNTKYVNCDNKYQMLLNEIDCDEND